MNSNGCILMVKNPDYEFVSSCPTTILEIHKVSIMELIVDTGLSIYHLLPQSGKLKLKTHHSPVYPACQTSP